jgi:membrane protease YdiL (CAAX protease family)
MDMQTDTEALTPRQLFAPVKRAEYLLWGIALVAMVLLVVPGSRRFYVAMFATAGGDLRLTEWQSILWHHGATFLVFTLPLLLMRPLGIYRRGVSLFAPGDWRTGLAWTLVAAAVVTGPTWVSSHDPQFLREYPLAMHAFDSPLLLAGFFATYLCYYIGWEAFFRGFLGFGLRGLGYTPFLALMVQVGLSTIIHIGKPDMELISAIPGGIFMGVLAYRTRSLLWPLLFHFYVGIINTTFCWMHR